MSFNPTSLLIAIIPNRVTENDVTPKSEILVTLEIISTYQLAVQIEKETQVSLRNLQHTANSARVKLTIIALLVVFCIDPVVFVQVQKMSSRVPIPRLSNQHTDQKPGRRIARACDECRSRKSKCNGHRPICGQCTSAGLESCVYSDPKRSREQKALESANEQVARYECILREIYQEVDKRPAKKIKEALVCNIFFVFCSS